jgi:hypothetical protein
MVLTQENVMLEAISPPVEQECYIFREAVTYTELLEMFKMRYVVHREAGYIPENPDGLDIDSYDLHSRFLCGYLRSGGKERLVASMRVVLPGVESPHAWLVRRIAMEARDGRLDGLARPTFYFPTEEAFELTGLVKDILSQGDGIIELSRTTRVGDIKDFKLSFTLSYGACALAMICGASYALGSGEMQTCRLYKMIGGAKILNETARVHPSIGVKASAILVDFNGLQPEIKTIIESNARDLDTKGFFTVPVERRSSQEKRAPSALSRSEVLNDLLSKVSSN